MVTRPQKKTFNTLYVPDHWKQYWTKYPEGYTILEALINWTSQVDDMVKTVNSWQDFLDWFVDQFQETLKPVVRELLEEMEADGTLSDLINDTIFGELNDKIDGMVLNGKYPPLPLQPLLMDGVTDETDTLQSLLDHLESVGGGTLFIPEGTLIHTINFIPDNVEITGAGMNRTTIKLKDDQASISVRHVLGLYPKYGIDYFAVRNLTYDGNALNNVDVAVETNYDSFYAHGICNNYIDPTQDPYDYILDAPDERVAKDFVIENIHIKDTVRNNLLLGGKVGNKGLVRNVILENPYLDHFVYESGTNAKFKYENITTVGTWRGAGLVIENGEFNKVNHIKPFKHPNPNLDETSYLHYRNSGLSKIRSSVQNIELDVLFEGLHAIIIESRDECSYTIDNMKINQLDTVSVNIYGAPVPIILGRTGKDVKLTNVECNNVMAMNLAYIQTGATNYFISDVVFNYNSARVGDEPDHILSVSHTGVGEISNIEIKNIIANEKAPSLINLSGSSSSTSTTTLFNILFDNVILRGATGTTKEIFKNILTDGDNFSGRKFVIKNSYWSGFAGMGIDHGDYMYDTLNLVLDHSFHNGSPSNQTIRVPFPLDTQTVTVPYGYIMRPPRNVTIYNMQNGSHIPTITIQNLEIVVSFEAPVTQYEEVHITLSYD